MKNYRQVFVFCDRFTTGQVAYEVNGYSGVWSTELSAFKFFDDKHEMFNEHE